MGHSKETFMTQREAEFAASQSEMMNPLLREIAPIKLTKGSVLDHAGRICAMVRDRKVNPLDAATKLAYMAQVIDEAKKLLRPEFVDERQKYQKGEDVTSNGAKIELGEFGIGYDYANCGDPHWESLDAQIKGLTEKKKEREEFLRTIKAPIGIADEFTGGETIVLNPPIKTSTTNIKITFPK